MHRGEVDVYEGRTGLSGYHWNGQYDEVVAKTNDRACQRICHENCIDLGWVASGRSDICPWRDLSRVFVLQSLFTGGRPHTQRS